MENKAMLVLDSQSALGEGPHWDHKKILYWVDIIEGNYISMTRKK